MLLLYFALLVRTILPSFLSNHEDINDMPVTSQESLYKEGLVRESYISAPRPLHHCCNKKYKTGNTRAFYSLVSPLYKGELQLSFYISFPKGLCSVQIHKSKSRESGIIFKDNFDSTTSPIVTDTKRYFLLQQQSRGECLNRLRQ